MDRWLERGFMALLSLVSLYVSNQLGTLSRSVQDLNVKMAVYINKSDSVVNQIIDHESRIRNLERRP